MSDLSRDVLQRVCQDRHIFIADLLGLSHEWKLVAARREAARELRSHGLSLPAIGRLLHRHHTTVLNLLQPKIRADEHP